MNTILETKKLCKYYGSGENMVKAVDNLDLTIYQGEFVTIVGKSGSGNVKDIIRTLGLESKVQSMPNTLSGGQQQRTAIARAAAAKPSIILADEPTGNLDTKTGDEVMAMLKLSAKKYGQTLVVITHNEDIAQMADRTVVIEDGRIVG